MTMPIDTTAIDATLIDTPLELKHLKNQQVEVYLGIGSNVESKKNIRFSLAALDQEFGLIKQSSVYKSPALNGKGQDYLNLVVSLKTNIALEDLSTRLKLIEDKQGRNRPTTMLDADEAKNSSRQKEEQSTQVTIDLDILFFGDLQGTVGDITLPHRDILACSYVLKPLSELVPHLKHPVEKFTMAQLWQRLYAQNSSSLVEVKLF